MSVINAQVGGEGFHVGCDWSRLSFSPDASYVTCGAGDGAVISPSTLAKHFMLVPQLFQRIQLTFPGPYLVGSHRGL